MLLQDERFCGLFFFLAYLTLIFDTEVGLGSIHCIFGVGDHSKVLLIDVSHVKLMTLTWNYSNFVITRIVRIVLGYVFNSGKSQETMVSCVYK